MASELQLVRDALAADEILAPGDPEYGRQSQTWAAQRDLHPRLVARPKAIDSLSKLLGTLNETSLKVSVRSQGFGNGTAEDVLISMTAFDSFEYDLENETVTIGAGQPWATVDEKMEKYCPGYATLSTRSGFLGVGGSIVHGGLSWASSERGAAARPGNLLDAQVVKADGTALWASSEPDLLWCLRGGGHSFGLVTKVKVKIFPYPPKVFSGRLIYPRSSLREVAREVAAFSRRVSDPKCCMHLYCMTAEENTADEFPDELAIGNRQDSWSRGMDSSQISLWLYDAHGEEHARSQQGFGWAFKITGAKDKSMSLSYKETNRLASEFPLQPKVSLVLILCLDELEAAKGVTDSWFSAPLVAEITEELILRAWDWFHEVMAAAPVVKSVPLGCLVIFEIMQKVGHKSLRRYDLADADGSFKPAIYAESPRTDCAWPHSRCQHILQIGVAVPAGDDHHGKIVYEAMEKAPKQICPQHQPGDYLPNFVMPFNDVSAVSFLVRSSM